MVSHDTLEPLVDRDRLQKVDISRGILPSDICRESVGQSERGETERGRDRSYSWRLSLNS
jgi:hypothetical protein